MIKIKQILSFWKGSVFNCFSYSQTSDSTNSLPISHSLSEAQPLTYITQQFNQNNLLISGNKLEKSVSVINYENDLFLINKPSTYSKLLEGFINHHGVGSPNVNKLVSPEITLGDRVNNIHLIMGELTLY
jgi:hypothetical protein